MENSTFNKKIIFLLIGILILPFFTNAESILNNKALQTTMVANKQDDNTEDDYSAAGEEETIKTPPTQEYMQNQKQDIPTLENSIEQIDDIIIDILPKKIEKDNKQAVVGVKKESIFNHAYVMIGSAVVVLCVIMAIVIIINRKRHDKK